MTRRGLFGWLAAIGMGQHVFSYVPKEGEGGFQVNCDTKGNCKADGFCATGLERCPLGHCQKPRKEMFPFVSEDGGTLTLHTDIHPAAMMYGERVHICSICGIVYVPVKEKP